MNVSRETTEPAPLGVRLNVSRETTERLDRFANILLKWNRRINLVSRADEARLWDRHIGDSLQLVPLLPIGGRIVDLGSGGGFPGLVLAIVTGRIVTLIESDSRKAAFLREAARQSGAAVNVIVSRIEDAHCREEAEIITARALAPLPRLLDLAFPLLAHGGICLFLKGAAAAEELTACEAAWNMVVERHPSRIDPQGCILRLSEVSRV